MISLKFTKYELPALVLVLRKNNASCTLMILFRHNINVYGLYLSVYLHGHARGLLVCDPTLISGLAATGTRVKHAA